MTITTWIASYGAVLSTITLIWNVWRQLREGGRLQLTFEVQDVHRSYLTIKIANVGTRAITPVRLAGRKGTWWSRRGETQLWVDNELPKKLDPEESTVIWPPEHGWKLDGLRALWIEDQTSHRWRVRRSELKRAEALSIEVEAKNRAHKRRT